jgi:hypothetical protein
VTLTVSLVVVAASTGCTVFEDQVSLLNCGVISTATGTRRVRVETDCHHNLHIEIEDVPRGVYAVLVDGVERGSIRVGAKHGGQFEFDTSPKDAQLPIDFDPFGHVDVASAGRVILSLDQCPAQ